MPARCGNKNRGVADILVCDRCGAKFQTVMRTLSKKPCPLCGGRMVNMSAEVRVRREREEAAYAAMFSGEDLGDR